MLSLKRNIAAAATLILASASSAALLTSATLPWGPTRSHSDLVDHINNPANHYARPDSITRSDLSPMVPAGTVFNILPGFPLELFFLGGFAENVHVIGFDLYKGADTSGTFLGDIQLSPQIGGKDATKFGSTFSRSIEELLATVGAAAPDLGDVYAIDFWVTNSSPARYGELDVKLKLSEGVFAFDFTEYLELGTGPNGEAPFGPLPSPLEFVFGWEDMSKGGGTALANKSNGDFGDIFLSASVADIPTIAVPEPSTYGLIGAITLVGLVVRRLVAASKAA